MRIFGGHDYYDSAQAYGHDPKIVFTRTDELVDGKTVPLLKDVRTYFGFYKEKDEKQPQWKRDSSQIVLRNATYDAYSVYILFCGRIYHGIQIVRQQSWPDYKSHTETFWQRDAFESWLSDHGYKLSDERGYHWSFGDPRKPFFVEQLTGDAYDWAVKNRVVTGIPVDRNSKAPKWKINFAGLNEYDFYRVFDAVQAFQEIDMWMSGALGLPGNPMVEISDEDRLAKHGMDKWSFRKKVR